MSDIKIQGKINNIKKTAIASLVIFLGSFFYGVFGFGTLAVRAVAPALEVKEIHLQTQLSEVKDGAYNVEISLAGPEELKVGDLVSFGARSVDTIKSFGIGWLDSSQIGGQCEGIVGTTAQASPAASVAGEPEKKAESSTAGQGTTADGSEASISDKQQATSGVASDSQSVNSGESVATKQASNISAFQCDGAAFFALSQKEIKAGEPIKQAFGVNGLSQELAKKGDVVVAVVETSAGKKWAWVNTVEGPDGKAVLAHDGSVLGVGSLVCAAGTIGALICIGGVAVPDLAFKAINSVMAGIIGTFNEFLYALFSVFIAPSLEALLSIKTYKDGFAAPIFPAWKVLRNLSNILFILAILGIGLSTLFRVGGWKAKDMLVNLIIGAILINFSLVIAQLVLGVADTLQAQFMPADSGAIRYLGAELMIKGKGLSIINSANPENHLLNQNWPSDINFGSFDATVKLLIGFVLTFGSFIAFGALWFFILIRTLFLWVFLLASPLAYAGMAMPLTRKSTTSRWWSGFIGYAFMTPVVAFMINLTALIAKNQKNVIYDLSNDQFGFISQSFKTVMYAIMSQVIVIGFLFMAIKAASWMKLESGEYVKKVSDKGWGYAQNPYKTSKNTVKGTPFVGSYLNTRYQVKSNQAKEWYYGKLNDTLGPVDKDGNPRTGSWGRRFMYNVMSGGKYDEAWIKESQSKMEAKKGALDSDKAGKDWRAVVQGKTPTAAAYAKRNKQNELIHEHDQIIQGELGATTVNDADRLLSGGIKALPAYAQFMSKLKKVLEDRNLDELMSKTGVDNIEGFYGYLAKQGLNDEQLGAVMQTINNKQLEHGYLQNIVSYDTPMKSADLARAYDAWRAGPVGGGPAPTVGSAYTYTNAAGAVVSFGTENQAYRNKRWGAKNEIDQAKDIPPAALFVTTTAGAATNVVDVRQYAADWIRNFANLDYADPAAQGQARAMVGALSSEKRGLYRQVVNDPALWAAVEAHLPAAMRGGTGIGTAGNAKDVLNRILPV